MKNPKFNRYWFRLKGDVLSYYTDPSELYFPAGNIDLRYGISANITEKEKGKDATYFTVVTHQRKFHFKADSAPSAKEWVKSLQKIIFRSHNEGDSVKISLPIENIIDIEESQIIDFAETCKIRVIDNDETYAIDEVSKDNCEPRNALTTFSTSSLSSILGRRHFMSSKYWLKTPRRNKFQMIS